MTRTHVLFILQSGISGLIAWEICTLENINYWLGIAIPLNREEYGGPEKEEETQIAMMRRELLVEEIRIHNSLGFPSCGSLSVCLHFMSGNSITMSTF